MGACRWSSALNDSTARGYFQGSAAHPVNGARLLGRFFGNDGASGAGSGISLDTDSRDHIVTPTFTEMGGVANIFVSAHNANTNISVRHLVE